MFSPQHSRWMRCSIPTHLICIPSDLYSFCSAASAHTWSRPRRYPLFLSLPLALPLPRRAAGQWGWRAADGSNLESNAATFACGNGGMRDFANLVTLHHNLHSLRLDEHLSLGWHLRLAGMLESPQISSVAHATRPRYQATLQGIGDAPRRTEQPLPGC